MESNHTFYFYIAETLKGREIVVEKFDILEDIATRTNGDIYLGVVGPVRTGKSTFIKRFMELLVLPGIEDAEVRQRAVDELPQSGAGKTVMTTEPKFIPAEAAPIQVKDGLSARVRLVDCVGYGVPSALGFQEEDIPRMVNTPWFEEAIPFQQAAEIGTQKVISDHSTIGIVVTADNSITGIERADYADAEERVVGELQELGKPFLIVFNTTEPASEMALAECERLREQYNTCVLPMNVAQMEQSNVLQVLQELLFEFPVSEINISLPRWFEELPDGHWLQNSMQTTIGGAMSAVRRVRDVDNMVEELSGAENIVSALLEEMDLGSGLAKVVLNTAPELFYQVLAEYAGEEIEGEHTLLRVLRDFSYGNREWGKVSEAMEEAKTQGYGVVTPRVGEMYLEEPELIKQGGRFGVRLKASAPSFHVLRANISTEITPLIGTEKQCEELVRYILSEFEEDPQKIWQTNIFGKSLNELVQEGIQGKLYKMPENAQAKLQETLQRIVNEGGGGVICIIL
jgi:stage IV sporulation protein A